MKIPAMIAVLWLGTTSAFAQAPTPPPAPGTAAGKGTATQEVVYEGELETYIAVGGESTGWRLRMRTAQGQRRYIEVLLTAEVAQGVRANTRVQVRGLMKTRHYPERGDVDVLIARSVIEVARTR
jgi:hypothetical protein